MRHRSVRIRLTLWYTSLLGVTFVILGLIAYVLVSYTVHKQTDSALRSVATALAESHAAETSRYFPPEVDEIFRRFFGSPPLGPYFEWLIPEKDLEKNRGSRTRRPSPGRRGSMRKGAWQPSRHSKGSSPTR